MHNYDEWINESMNVTEWVTEWNKPKIDWSIRNIPIRNFLHETRKPGQAYSSNLQEFQDVLP